jgi:hypothetical protein
MTSPRFAVSRHHNGEAKRFADRRLRDAFLALTRHLPNGRSSVPTHRSHFDNVARPDGQCIAHRGQGLRDLLQDVMRAAVETGDQLTIDETRTEIESFLTIMLDQVLSVIPRSSAAAFAAATVEATRDVAEFEAAAAEAGTTRDPSAMQRAARVGLKAEHSIEAFGAEVSRQLHGNVA